MSGWRCFASPPLDDPPQEVEMRCSGCNFVFVIINPTSAFLENPRCSVCLREAEEHLMGCRCPDCDPDFNDPRNDDDEGYPLSRGD